MVTFMHSELNVVHHSLCFSRAVLWFAIVAPTRTATRFRCVLVEAKAKLAIRTLPPQLSAASPLAWRLAPLLSGALVVVVEG